MYIVPGREPYIIGRVLKLILQEKMLFRN